MVIVHVAASSPYNENWGYQENLLPRYQRKMGNDVTLIVSCKKIDQGTVVETPEEDRVLNDGVRLIRKKQVFFINKILSDCLGYVKVFSLLETINPDLIFYHGLISFSIIDVIKYKKKHKNCTVVQDNHLDYNIGFHVKTIKSRFLRSYYRFLNMISIKYVDKVYGVTPWREEYASDYFHIPKEKIDLLIMGADDEKIDFNNKEKIRKTIRNKFNVNDDEFLIVTGGKIDAKKNVDVLVEACKEISSVKLLLFGQISDEMKEYFDNLISENENVIMVGWINSDIVYEFFFAADLVFFPGQHSVLWEQACASKVPCVFAKWDGMEHVDVGGNCEFVYPVNKEEVQKRILDLQFSDKYYKMKSVAESDLTNVFLYSNIAKKSLECCKY